MLELLMLTTNAATPPRLETPASFITLFKVASFLPLETRIERAYAMSGLLAKIPLALPPLQLSPHLVQCTDR